MKKIIKSLNVLLFLIAIALLSSCQNSTKKNEKIEFNFDDRYFIGMQEHYYEIRNMERTLTNDFVGDLNQAVGSKVFRLNVTMNNLFYVDTGDTVKFNQSVKEQMRKIIDKLVETGVERIIYATDSFIYPYGYKYTHAICAPDPYSERDAYERWLKVNAAGYGMMAREFPEIKYFEPINEPDIPNNEVICRNGMLWGTKQIEFMYSAKDEANICADLCYYIRQEIKKVDKNNMMSTPAFSTLSTSKEYWEYFYEAIESGAHPTGDNLPCSVDPDDYFDIVNSHPYSSIQTNVDPLSPTENGVYLMTDNFYKACLEFYEICARHGDAEKPHWYSETGYTDVGDQVKEQIIGREFCKELDMIKEHLPFVECVILYKMTDFYEYNVDINEDHFGLFTALSDPDRPLEIKPIMKSLYQYMHNGSTDYSAIDAVRDKYLGK